MDFFEKEKKDFPSTCKMLSRSLRFALSVPVTMAWPLGRHGAGLFSRQRRKCWKKLRLEGAGLQGHLSTLHHLSIVRQLSTRRHLPSCATSQRVTSETDTCHRLLLRGAKLPEARE